MVLLLGLTDTKAEQLIQEEIHETPPLFYMLQKWNPSLCPGYGLTWVQCWGIPLLAWDTMQIKKIVVEVDDDVDERRRLDRARVLIKTPWKPAIQHTLNVYIDSEVYEVRILEECGYSTDICHCRRSSVMVSPEEIDSDGSFMGSPIKERTHASEKDDAARDTETPATTRAHYGAIAEPIAEVTKTSARNYLVVKTKYNDHWVIVISCGHTRLGRKETKRTPQWVWSQNGRHANRCGLRSTI